MKLKTQLKRWVPKGLIALSAFFAGCAAYDDGDPMPESTVLYTEVNGENTVAYGSFASVDLDQDGTADFSLSVSLRNDSTGESQDFMIASLRDSRIILNDLNALPYEAGFEVGEDISQDLIAWSAETGLIFSRLESSGSSNDITWLGPWREVTEGYLGVSIRKENQYHFGWIKLATDVSNNKLTVLGYAYETEVGQPIDTGQME